MNCASITVDKHGKAVTKESLYTKLCSGLIQSNDEGNRRCAQSHSRMGIEAAKTGKPYVGRCHAGLIDFAAPIIIDGKLIGTVLGGQVSDKEISDNLILNVSNSLNLDYEKCKDASTNIGIQNMKNIEAAAEVLYIVVNSLARNGYNELKLRNLSNTLSNNFINVSGTIEELSASAFEITNQQDKLSNEIKKISDVTENINNILVSIKSIAGQTKMLGLNASIEAARAGDAGKGFAVVAAEIKKLSDISRSTADDISKLTNEIQKCVEDTSRNAETTLSTTQQQSAAMEEVNASIQEALTFAEKLKNM